MLYLFGGGTVNFVRNHLALAAPAYGATARSLAAGLQALGVPDERIRLELTRMADPASGMETNADVARRLDSVLADPATRAIVFNVALCDFEGRIGQEPSGKYAARLRSREGTADMQLTPAAKLLPRVKARRPDVFLVGFKTTAGEAPIDQYDLALRQLKETGADRVIANDTVTRNNLMLAARRGVVRTFEGRSRESLLNMLCTDLMKEVS